MIVRTKIVGIDPPMAGHAEVEDQRVATIGVDQPEFGAAADVNHTCASQPLAKILGEGPAEVRAPRFDALQPPPAEHARQPANGGFDFGELGHGWRYGEGPPSPLEAPR